MPGYFSVFSILFTLVFAAVAVSVIVNAVRSAKRSRADSKAPRLTVRATVVAKDKRVTSHGHNAADANGVGSARIHTYYSATFQVDSGDRLCFDMSSYDYNLLIEGDIGNLSFQGSRFLGFERQ